MKLDITVDVDFDEEEMENISFSSVIDAVCEGMVVPKELLLSKSRPAFLCEARFIAYYLGWLMTQRSLPSLGRHMGRDHTTVLYGRDKCIRLMREREGFKDKVEMIKGLAYGNERKRKKAAAIKLADIKREVEAAAIEASFRLATKGYLSGDKVIFPRLDTQ